MDKELFILDVSGYIYRAYYALPHFTNPAGESTQGLYGFIRSIIKLFKTFSPDHLVAVFDSPDNKKQRREIYEKYKATRVQKAEDLPEQIDKAKIFCKLMGIGLVEAGGVEADDSIGTIALWAEKQGYTVYICTSDKDLCQMVRGNIYLLNPWKEYLQIDAKKVEELYGVPPEKIVDLLAIMGDQSDNIPGLYGFGPKTAVSLLKEFGTLENLLDHPEKVSGKKKQETLLQEADIARLSKRLATIHTDIDVPQEKSFYALNKPDITGLREFYLEQGFNTLVKELEVALPQKEEKKTHYTLVEDKAAFDLLLKNLSAQKELSFDVETTHIRPLLARAVGIGFCYEEGVAYYVPLNGKLEREYVLEKLKPLFANAHIGFYGHNVKYDLHVLATEGIKVAHIAFDTILASYILNSANRRHSLDHLALHYFGKVKTPIKTLIGSGKKEITMDKVPLQQVSDYCCEDVDYTFRIKQILAEELHTRKMTPLLFDLELPLMTVLAKMERAGMFLDKQSIEKTAHQISKERDAVEQEIYKITGETFNINSPKQLSVILFEKMGITPLKKTATGLSTRAEVLETLAAEHPIAEKILLYRGLDKLLSTYLEPLPHEINPVSGRVHPTFNQSVAATGRLACQDPNLQNIPVRTAQGRKIREAFRPQHAGWSFLAADYSQIELRLLAHLSEDPHLIEAFNKGEDIHTYTASLVFGVPLEQVTKKERQSAKAINFGIIYGQQAYGLSQQLGIDIRASAEFIEAYFDRYPHVMSFIETCIKEARKTGKAVTMTGREREIPEIHSSNGTVRSAAERLASNTPLQGSAADMIKMAMLQIDEILTKKKMGSYMLLQVHDELIFEAPDEELEELTAIVKKTMEEVVSLKVPLLVNIAIGKNWSQC